MRRSNAPPATWLAFAENRPAGLGGEFGDYDFDVEEILAEREDLIGKPTCRVPFVNCVSRLQFIDSILSTWPRAKRR